MCATPMRLVMREHVDRLPGRAETHRAALREWVCPECGYFEEVMEDDG